MKKNNHGLPILEATERPRRRLFALNRMCFWCGRLTRLHSKQRDPDLATVDHLYSRLHIKRAKNKTKVLACQECNHARSVADQRGFPFVPKLVHRQDVALAASACNKTQREAAVPTESIIARLPKPRRACKHLEITNVLDAHEHRHTVQKITGLRATVEMCGRCGSWRVVITDRLTKPRMEKVCNLLSQHNISIADYLN